MRVKKIKNKEQEVSAELGAGLSRGAGLPGQTGFLVRHSVYRGVQVLGSALQT